MINQQINNLIGGQMAGEMRQTFKKKKTPEKITSRQYLKHDDYNYTSGFEHILHEPLCLHVLLRNARMPSVLRCVAVRSIRLDRIGLGGINLDDSRKLGAQCAMGYDPTLCYTEKKDLGQIKNAT